MRVFLFWSLTILFALQESNCGTAGSIQDREVTAEKRAADEVERYPTPTPTPVVMRDVFRASSPADEHMMEKDKIPHRLGAKKGGGR